MLGAYVFVGDELAKEGAPGVFHPTTLFPGVAVVSSCEFA